MNLGAPAQSPGAAGSRRPVCRMKIITDEQCTGYSHPGHPEKPFRISRTLEKLRAQNELRLLSARPGVVEDATILRAHAPELLASLSKAEEFDADTPAYPGIANYARASVGAALE